MKTGVYRQQDHVVTRRIADEVLLVPVKAKLADMRRVFVLHGTGEFIWEHLDGKMPLSGILDELVGCYDVNEKRAAADLDELIEDLLKAELIHKVP